MDSVLAEQAARVQAERAQRAAFLTEATTLLSSSLDYETTLQSLARLAVPFLADLCVIDMVADDGSIRRVAAAHANPVQEAVVEDLRRRFPPDAAGPHPVAVVLRTGTSQFVGEVGETDLARIASTPEHLAIACALDYHSYVVVPLVARGRTLGALSLVVGESGRRYTADDLAAAEDLGRRAGLAVDNARLYSESEARRRAAEALAETSRAVSQALDAEVVADRIATRVCELFACTLAIVYQQEGATGDFECVALAGEPGPGFGTRFTFPAGAGASGLAVRERRAVTTSDLMHDPRILLPDDVRAKLQLGPALSALAVPLIARGRAIGALFVGAAAGRVFTAHEVEIAQSFADHAALALDNAWLYQDAERRRREAEVIADIAATINAAEHLDIMLQRVAWGARELTGSDQALIALRDFASGEMRFRYWAGTLYAQMDSVLIEPGKGAGGIAIVTGQPVRTSDYAADPKLSKEYVDIATVDSVVALLVVPIKIVGRVEGLIYVGNRTTRAFTDHDETNLLRLADHAGIAVRNFRHLNRERDARAEAEAASRMKDEFLANLSHELRTPLTAVLGWARLVRSAKLDAAGLERALDTIERNAHAQTQIIEDLLDVSRIITGKLRLDSQPADLPQVIEAALDSVRPAADAKAIMLTADLDRTLRRVPADAARIQQVVWNLLANALKFTPRGGRITVALVRAGDEVRITVSDTGVGIPPEFLPHVFERFSQADPSTTRKHGGLGLGLAIVRHLVELHGGAVAAHSAGEGQGATFTVTLPLKTGTAPARASSGRPARRAAGARASASAILEGRRVLIVEDDADTRELFSSVLRGAGAHVWAVASVREGLEMLESITPDVLVADIGMPDQDGYDLISRVRALPAPLGRLPAVAITAYVGPRDHEQALASGYNAHVPKPIEPEQLRRIVARLCVRARAS